MMAYKIASIGLFITLISSIFPNPIFLDLGLPIEDAEALAASFGVFISDKLTIFKLLLPEQYVFTAAKAAFAIPLFAPIIKFTIKVYTRFLT